MTEDLSIVIVTYNNSKDIVGCLKSIEKNVTIPHEIILVDNDSTDNTLAKIHSSQVKVRLFPQKENLGFSRANNLGVEQTQGQYLLFLNPDTEIQGEAVDKMISFMQKYNVGIVAPKLIMKNGQPQPSVRKLPTLWGAIKEYFLGKEYSYEAFVPKGERPIEVESVVGAAMLIEKAVFEKAGYFNEQYQLYFEDLDLCRSIKKLGVKIFYLPTTLIKHKIGVSTVTNPNAQRLLEKSAAIYHGKLKAWILYWIIRVHQLLQGLKPYYSILILALLIRLLIMPFLFHPDIKVQYFQANFLQQGVVNIYQYLKVNKSQLGNTEEYNYPLLTYFTLGSWAYVTQPILGQPFRNWLYDWGENRWTNPQLFRQLFILKLPYLFLDLLCGVLIAYLVEESLRKKALIIWFFNPITLYIIYALANFDIIPTFLTLFSLFLFQKNKFLASGLSLGLGISLKLFPLLLMPFFVLMLLKKADKKGLVTFLIGVSLMIALTLCLFFKDFLTTSGSGMASQIFLPTLTLTNNLKIPIFYLLYPLLLLGCLFSKDTWESLNIYILAVFWLVLSLIHFHPQWLLWSLPFFVIIVAKDLRLLIQSGLIFISFILLVLTFEDRFLTLGIFSPIFPHIYDIANLEQTLFTHIPKSLVDILAKLLFILTVLTVLVPKILIHLNIKIRDLRISMLNKNHYE